MKTQRLATVLLALAGVLAAFVDPVAAAGYTTVTEQLIRDLNSELLAVAVPITLLVEGILVYTVWKFRKNDEAQPTRENRRLEITWTVATAVLLLFVGVGAYGAMANPYVTATQADADQAIDDGAVVVDAVGYQWYWSFEYPEQNVTTRGTMVVPAGQDVVIRTKSADVIHSFHAPELALKADAIPGQTNYIITRVNTDQTGTYQLYCAEFCGAGHSEMLGKITVVSPDKYQEWVDDPENTSIEGGA
jgi:cytochrome c oxidase subunit 2